MNNKEPNDDVELVIDKSFHLSDEAQKRIRNPNPSRPIVDFTAAMENHYLDILKEIRKRREEYESQISGPAISQ